MNKTLITSFEHACEVLGVDPAKLPGVEGLPERKAKAITADYKLSMIRDAQNKEDDFTPDFKNSSQYKWYPWLWFDPSVGAFVFQYTDFTGTGTALGSRFCFEDEDTAEFFGKTHIALHNDLMQDL